MSLDISGAAIIVDEGHNIEDVCRGGCGLDLRAMGFDAAVKEVRDIGEKNHDTPMIPGNEFLVLLNS